MIIGVPKEIKNHEYRVGLTPRSVKEFINHGHKVLVQTNAGVGIGASDQEYADTGAEIIATAKEVFDTVEMTVANGPDFGSLAFKIIKSLLSVC